MNVDFVDLKAQYHSIKEDIDFAIREVIDETSFIKGELLTRFEKKYAELIGVKHCVGVANGTDALFIVLKMLGIGQDDEVITVCNSWISTSEVITLAGAKPVFVDIDEYFLIDVSQIENKINEKTKAIIPVHLYGQPAEMKIIKNICKKHNLRLIEDCAQAHLAKFEEAFVGSIGDAGTFSFFPGKNLGAYGDAGCIVTNNKDLADKCRMFANHGALKKHNHIIEGVNSRLDTLQANILYAKLSYIKKWTKMRQEIASIYDLELGDISEIELPRVKAHVQHVFHLYVIRTKYRDQLKEFLLSKGITALIHYPNLIPLQPAYQRLRYSKSDFPSGYNSQESILSLPIFPELGIDKIQYISSQIHSFFSNYS